MIVVKRKPFEEIRNSIKGYRSILIVGCGTCSTICHAGGQTQVSELNVQLDMVSRLDRTPIELGAVTIERQCDRGFFAPLEAVVDDYDAILSMACGAGVQFLAESYPRKPVIPAVDTLFVGITQCPGTYEERCRCCGRCLLAMTAGVCPVTMCAKKLLNGPCGGVRSDGTCEVRPELPCAWCVIYERLRLQDRLKLMESFAPPVDWMDQVPSSVIQPEFSDADSGGSPAWRTGPAVQPADSGPYSDGETTSSEPDIHHINPKGGGPL